LRWSKIFCVFLIGIFACSKPTREDLLERFQHSVEKAAADAWDSSAAVQDSTLDSMAYHAARNFFDSARSLELSKQRWEDSIASQAMLSIEGLRIPGARSRSLSILQGYFDLDSQQAATLNIFYRDYADWVTSRIDSLTTDSLRRTRARKKLLRVDYFIPNTRARYEPLQRSVLERYQQVILLIDENRKQIEIDSVIRFSDPQLASRYTLLRFEIDSLADAERAMLGLPRRQNDPDRSDREQGPN
jgi:hypothetical protein